MKTALLGDAISSSRSGFASGKRSNDGVVQLRMNNVSTDGTLDLTSFIRVPATEQQVSELSLIDGDVLFNSTNSAELVGKTCLFKSFPEPVVFSNHFVRLQTNPEILFSDYLARWLAWTRDKGVFTHGCVKWVNQATYKKADLLKLQIPLPPLPEQKRIAGILDATDALRGKRRESLAPQLDTLLQSTFLDMFGDPVTNPMGWEMAVIGDLLRSVNYGTSKKADATDGAYPILRMGNITYSGGWDFENMKYIDLDEKELGKHLVHRGQILFNRTNSKALVGKPAVYREDQPVAFAGYLVRGVVNESADAEYVGAFMNTPQIKQFLQNKCKNIVGMANINAKEFQAIPIAAPPSDFQHRFAAIVESVEQQKASQRAHLAELDTLFASLQSRAFNGEL